MNGIIGWINLTWIYNTCTGLRCCKLPRAHQGLQLPLDANKDILLLLDAALHLNGYRVAFVDGWNLLAFLAHTACWGTTNP